MATEKQIAANRRNSLKSTGPRTPEGKAVSRLNALRHGLRSSAEVVPGEHLNELARIREAYMRLTRPAGPAELRLVEQMACAKWKWRNWQCIHDALLKQPGGSVNLSIFYRIDQRRGHYLRAFNKAYGQLVKLTGTPWRNPSAGEAISQV